MKRRTDPIEIMSPAGTWETLAAALEAGAGSVYFGAGNLNMRSRSSLNFTIADLREVAAKCKEYGAKSYLALNTIIYDSEAEEMRKMVDAAAESGISAIIATDFSAILYARSLGVEVHASTQLNISNFEAVRYFAQFCDVIVLARELTLEQISEISKKIKESQLQGPSGKLLRLEVFVHGALCMAISGKCYLSLHDNLHSANRGGCVQNCRRSYTVHDTETGNKLEIDHQYIMSPSDLCTLPFLDRILDAGITVLKIEGRARSPEYVKITTEVYKSATDDWKEGHSIADKLEERMDRLKKVFNRGLWEGYYLGKKAGEWSQHYGSSSTHVKEYRAKILKYFQKAGVAEALLETGTLATGDKVYIIGPTTGASEQTISEIWVDDKSVDRAEKGQTFTFPSATLLRPSDRIYIETERTKHQSL